jgi:hypothetical protein
VWKGPKPIIPTTQYWRIVANYRAESATSGGIYYNRNGEYGLYDTHVLNSIGTGGGIGSTNHPDLLPVNQITTDNVSILSSQIAQLYNKTYTEQLGTSSIDIGTGNWNITYEFTEPRSIKQLLMNGPASDTIDYMSGLDEIKIEYSSDNTNWAQLGQTIDVFADMVTKYGGSYTQSTTTSIHSWQYSPTSLKWEHVNYYTE